MAVRSELLLRSRAEILENARLAVENDPVRIAMESEAARASRRLYKAMMLAPSIEICEALLRGENVPIERLNPIWVRKFGLR
jgi:hypothetical protein